MQKIQEHISLLREHIALLEQELDTCERKERREILRKELDLCRPELEELEGIASESPRLVTRGGERVYLVRSEDEKYLSLERVEFRSGWTKTGEMIKLRKIFKWRDLTPQEIQEGLDQKNPIRPEWVGMSIRNEDGTLCNLLGRDNEGNYLVQVVVENGNFMHKNVQRTISKTSGGWFLVRGKY
nr:hypothetical protein MarFTME_017 [Marseillevirus futianmevirus]